MTTKKKLTKRQLNGLIQLQLGRVQGRNIESLEEVIRIVKKFDKNLAYEMTDTVIKRMIKLKTGILE